MPNKLFPNKIKTWWQQRFNNKQDTLDWRSLSPDHPPLPFLSPEILPSTIIDSSILQMESSPIQHHSSIMIATNSSHKARKDQPITTPLFPILEESETMITEESCSNVNQNTTIIQRSPETSSTCSTPSFHPPTSLSILDCVGDEDKCKQLFARMIVEMRQDHAKPSHLSFSFDANGNIHTLHMLIQGQVSHQKFDGVSQCLPPEVMNNHYNSDKADVWMLGIHLYKLLTGKYPFYASNDQQLFKKMLHTNFSIPNELSEDAKDILRRMLAPDLRNRASLDLIIYHPWLKPYMHVLLPDHNHPPRQQPVSTPQGKKRSRFKPLRQVLLLFLHGPFPPPKKPYRDLSHLGTRDSVFARQRQM